MRRNFKNKKKVVPVFVDVEADGPSPVTHSLLQIGAVDIFGQSFKADIRPREGQMFEQRALDAIGMTREQTLAFPDAAIGIEDFHAWLDEEYVSRNQRPIFWSDNPAFDWQFVNGYLSLYGFDNPFGFSARRIGDFFAGLERDMARSVQWKKWRVTEHTHDAEDDARGNMEAFKRILEEHNLRW
jgi:hypothetical protein